MQRFILILLATISFAAPSAWASNDPRDCAPRLADRAPLSRAGLTRLLLDDDTAVSTAIREIYAFLKVSPGSGAEKYEIWKSLVKIFNKNERVGWIIAPCMQTRQGHIVCWGGFRGNILVFRSDGEVFKDYNRDEPDPVEDPDYEIPWHRFR